MPNAVNVENPQLMRPVRVSQLSETDKKAIVFKALSEQGYNQNQVANLLNVDRSHINRIAKKEEKGLLAPLANVARRSIKALAKGQLVGQMTEIKGSDILGACKEIVSRAEPIINKSEVRSTHLNIDITSEDMLRINNLLGIHDNVIEGEIVK